MYLSLVDIHATRRLHVLIEEDRLWWFWYYPVEGSSSHILLSHSHSKMNCLRFTAGACC
jgi:hypothetical protein